MTGLGVLPVIAMSSLFAVAAGSTGVLPRFAFRALVLGCGPAALVIADTGRGPWWLAVIGPAAVGCTPPRLLAERSPR